MCEFHGSNSNGFGDIWWTDNPIYFSSRPTDGHSAIFLAHSGLIPLLVFKFRVEEKFAGGKFRGKKISRNSMRS